MEKQDYTNLTLEQLISTEKKLKQKITVSALIAGLLLGIMIYGVVKNGFGFLYIFVPVLLLYGNYRQSKKFSADLRQIQSEILARNSK